MVYIWRKRGRREEDRSERLWCAGNVFGRNSARVVVGWKSSDTVPLVKVHACDLSFRRVVFGIE